MLVISHFNFSIDAGDLLSSEAHRLYNFENIGIENNEIREDVDVNEFVSVLISLIQGSVIQVKVTGKTAPLNARTAVTTIIVNIFFCMIYLL